MRAELADERIRYWGRAYLASTRESYRRAQLFFNRCDFFTAYLYLFVAFNNLYCFLARIDGTEPEKIRVALEKVPLQEIESFYRSDYVRDIRFLNDGPSAQFREGPDSRAPVEGIPNMRNYFLGKEPAQCVAHVDHVAPATAGARAKRGTLQEVAGCLLYAIRNNQFHAVKGARALGDQTTLKTAYQILHPIVHSLMPLGEEVVEA